MAKWSAATGKTRNVSTLFPRYNVRFIAVSGGIDSNTNSTDFVPLYSVMDERYARDISRKMRSMYQSRASTGTAIGSPVYGYTRSKGKIGLWEIDYEAATVVRYIYRLAFLGYGSEQIAKMLEADKILTPAHYHLKNGSKRIPRFSLRRYTIFQQREGTAYPQSLKEKICKVHERTEERAFVIFDTEDNI